MTLAFLLGQLGSFEFKEIQTQQKSLIEKVDGFPLLTCLVLILY